MDIFQRVNQNRYLSAIFILILVLVLYWSYTNVRPEIRNLNGDSIGVLGHRGMYRSYHYPGNSLPSILEALRIGAIGCEPFVPNHILYDRSSYQGIVSLG